MVKTSVLRDLLALYIIFRTLYMPMSTKNPQKWKKHSVSIFVLATTFEKIYARLIWVFPKYRCRKKGTSKTFLGFGLRPQPQKLFSQFPFSYIDTWETLKSDEHKFFLSRCKDKYRNKILLIFDKSHLKYYFKFHVCLSIRYPLPVIRNVIPPAQKFFSLYNVILCRLPGGARQCPRSGHFLVNY